MGRLPFKAKQSLDLLKEIEKNELETETLKAKLLVPDSLLGLMQSMMHPSAKKRPSCSQILQGLAMNILNEPSSVRESRSVGEGLKIEEAYQMN
jgi:hypothetical protein